MMIEKITISAKTPDLLSHTKIEKTNMRLNREKVESECNETTRLTEMVDDVHNHIQLINNVDLDFTVNQDSGDIVVTVRDKSTGKVIREIPSKEMQHLASNIDSMAGLLLACNV